MSRAPRTGLPAREEAARVRRAREGSCDANRSRLASDALAAGESRPLDPALRAEMEARFAADFGDVRLHDGPQASRAAAALSARAFTVGADIAFHDGFLQPDTAEGRRLLAHELAHVVQQRGTGGRSPPGAAHEAAADAAAASALRGENASAGPGAAVTVQREPLAPEDIDKLDLGAIRDRLAANDREAGMPETTGDAVGRLFQEREALLRRRKLLEALGPTGSAAVPGEALQSRPPAPRDPATAPGRTETGRPADPAAAAWYAARGIVAYGGSEVPFTDGTGPFHTQRAGPYILGPNAIQCENGEYAVLYYVAYHRERRRNEWVVGPGEAGQFLAGSAAYDQSAATGGPVDAGQDTITIPLDAEQAASAAVKGTTPHFLTESVPYTSPSAGGETIAAGPYDLVPRRINTASGQAVTLYYLARDRETGYAQWVIGPDELETFKSSAQAHHDGAALAYESGPPHEYEAESARWVWGAVDALMGDGKWSDAFGHLGKAWGTAVKDPKWQIQAILAHVPVERAVAPVLRWGARSARPLALATGLGISEAVPAVTMRNTGAVSAMVMGKPVAAEVRAASQELRQVAASELGREAAPAVARATAPAVGQVQKPLASQLPEAIGLGARAAAPAVGRQALPSPEVSSQGYRPAAGERSTSREAWKASESQRRWGKSVDDFLDRTFAEPAETVQVPRVKGGRSNPRIGDAAVPGRPDARLDIGKVPLRPGESAPQAVARVKTVIGRKLSEIPALRKLWDEARASVVAKQPLSASNYGDLYEKTRAAFWRRVRGKTPEAAQARQLLEDAGFSLPKGRSTAPMLEANDPAIGEAQRRISLDHVEEKARPGGWQKALDADNLRMEFAAPNTEREIIQMRHPSLR